MLKDTEPATLKQAVLEADVVVIDCINQLDLAEAILAAIADTKEFETPTTLIALSSALTWARTSTDADEPDTPLTEIEYKRRRPHSQFKQLLAVEKLVTRAKRPNLRTHVVAAGAPRSTTSPVAFFGSSRTPSTCTPNLDVSHTVTPPASACTVNVACVRLMEASLGMFTSQSLRPTVSLRGREVSDGRADAVRVPT